MTGTVHDILRRAESIGIRLRLEGARLKASLPDSADPRVLEVVEQLRIHRDEVRHFLDHPNGLTQQEGDDLPPTDPCYACGGLMYWRRPTGGYVCAECHPDPRWIPASKKIQ
jgi:hypothetical protein